ncbi:MAG: threonine synthase, partial [Planctomycetaceae bacterium]|nr:threonine synthase [Planctomycetaceae bacterium]
TGHQLKDPDATVAYHAAESDPKLAEKLHQRGIEQREFKNGPIVVPNDFEQIMDVIRSLG